MLEDAVVELAFGNVDEQLSVVRAHVNSRVCDVEFFTVKNLVVLGKCATRVADPQGLWWLQDKHS